MAQKKAKPHGSALGYYQVGLSVARTVLGAKYTSDFTRKTNALLREIAAGEATTYKTPDEIREDLIQEYGEAEPVDPAILTMLRNIERNCALEIVPLLPPPEPDMPPRFF